MYLYFGTRKWPAQGTSTVPIVSTHVPYCAVAEENRGTATDDVRRTIGEVPTHESFASYARERTDGWTYTDADRKTSRLHRG